MCEKKGEAVICIKCGGTGCKKIYYKPFMKRKNVKNIKQVSWSRGDFIPTGVGAVGSSISYKDFEKGKFPPKK